MSREKGPIPNPVDTVRMPANLALVLPELEIKMLTEIALGAQVLGIVGDRKESELLIRLINLSLQCSSEFGLSSYPSTLQQRDTLITQLPTIEQSSEQFQVLLAHFAAWHDHNFQGK